MDIHSIIQQLAPERFTQKTVRRGDVIVAENRSQQAVPIVFRGSLKVSRASEDGREVLVYYLGTGDCCVGTYLNTLSGTPCSLLATAETEAEVLFIPISYLNELMQSDFRWITYLHREISRRFDGLMQALDAASFQSLEQRLWSVLKRKADLRGERTVFVTHAALALELATARNVVSRILKQFEMKGKVRLGRGVIELL